MRVLHLVAGNLYGGVERILVTLARNQPLAPEMKSQFGLCVAGRLYDELLANTVPVHLLGRGRFSRPWTMRAARHKLQEVLERERIEIAVCHGAWAHAAFASTVRRTSAVRLVYYAHDVPRGTHWLERLARRVPPDLALANSHYTAGFMSGLFPSVPTQVQYPPVEPPPPMDHALVRSRMRAELKCAVDAVVIVCACRLEQWKGHALLLKALERLNGDPRWRCWIAGGAQRPGEQVYLEEFKRSARQHDISSRVSFLGERNDVPHLLAAADVHCQPNIEPEPFGVAFVEALDAGLAVVTADLGGAREILAGHADAILVPPRDETALANALRQQIDRATTRPPALTSERVGNHLKLETTLAHLTRVLRAQNRPDAHAQPHLRRQMF